MVRCFRLLSVLVLVFATSSVQALVLDVNGMYFQDSLNQPTVTTTKTWALADLALGIGLDQDKMYNLGFGIFSANNTETAGSAKSEWSTFDYGLKFITYFDRTKEWGIGLAYNPFAKATVNSSGTIENWRGTSLLVSLGYNPLFVFGTYFGLRLNYYLGTYTERAPDGGTYASQTNTRGIFYPSMFISFH